MERVGGEEGGLNLRVKRGKNYSKRKQSAPNSKEVLLEKQGKEKVVILRKEPRSLKRVREFRGV